MKSFQHILVATDFSDPAARALEIACRLAKELDARLTLLHVAWPPGAAIGAYVQGGLTTEADARREAESLLAIAVDRAQHVGVRAEPVLTGGEPWERILAVSKEKAADLVVMGTHARKGFSRLVLGSVAEKVVRLSPVPVLTTSSSSHPTAEFIPPREIVVATDFSQPAKLALDHAIELARRVGGRITVLHAFMLPQVDYGMLPYYPSDEVEAAAQKALDEEVGRAKTEYANVVGVVEFGDPAEHVFQLVAKNKADMVVIGTHGKKWISRVLLGTVADRVLRGCPVPVLTVPDAPS